jgi:serine kinase of HPr protein (carbohydrate metabolism regulator)
MTDTMHQATCVAIGELGVLIEGAPGAGKSSLALALIDRGAQLVGDDGVLLSSREGRVFATPHPNTLGLIEVRNLGLLRVPFCAETPVALVLRLDKAAPRFIDAPDTIELAGCALPLLRLWPDSPVLALKAELAIANYGLFRS